MTKGIFLPVVFIRICDTLSEAVLLGQIYYWFRLNRDGETKLNYRQPNSRGEHVYWLVKQYRDFEQETGLNERTLKRAMDWLVEKKIVETQVLYSKFYNGDRALHIWLDQERLLMWIVEKFGYTEIFPESDNLSLSENDNLALSNTESTSESKDSAPKSARYGYLLNGTSLDRSSTPQSDDDQDRTKVAFDSPEMPDVGRDVLSVVVFYNPKAKKELSRRQVDQLRLPVPTLKGEMPSPHDMKTNRRGEWDQFINRLPDMPAWKKRVFENKERVTPGLVIDFFRHYEWKGGFLSNAPDERQEQPTATDLYEDT